MYSRAPMRSSRCILFEHNLITLPFCFCTELSGHRVQDRIAAAYGEALRITTSWELGCTRGGHHRAKHNERRKNTFRMSDVGSIYAAYVLNKDELESNGVLTHQIIKFTKIPETDYTPYIRMDNVTEMELAKTIRGRICDNPAYALLHGRHSTEPIDVMLLYAIPDIENLGGLKLVSSHDGLTRVLYSVLIKLGCKYTRLSPDIHANVVDNPTYWTLTVTEIDKHYELMLMPGVQQEHFEWRPVSTTTNTYSHFSCFRLSEILHLTRHTDFISPVVVRNCKVPDYLGDVRTCETFEFPKTRKTPMQILCDINHRIGRTHLHFANLWNTIGLVSVFGI